MLRRKFLLTTAALAIAATLLPLPAFAAGLAADFIANNIHVGFELLNDRSLTKAQRKDQFASFLLSVTDVKRVALFLLGKHAIGASPVDIEAYVAAYREYVLAVYQSHFSRYAGQSLRVLDSQERSPTDFIVRTTVISESSVTPQEIKFRVRTDGPKPVLVDFSLEGLWLAVAQRDEFGAVLAQNNGDIQALISHLRRARDRYA